MEYENIDEVTRRQACENVKKIAEAIKKIRKKYYLCFNKISDVDKQRYDQLTTQMQTIANKNGLNKLNAELIADINTQYSENLPDDMDENGKPSKNSAEEAYQMYLKAVQLLAEFTVQFKNATDELLEVAYLKRAQKIQRYIGKLSDFLEESYSPDKLKQVRRNVLREKFGKEKEEDVFKLFQSYYEETNDPLIKNDILETLTANEIKKDVQQIAR